MAITGIQDAQDYQGGTPIATRIVCVDAGGHFNQSYQVLVNSTGVGFNSTAPAGKQSFLAALSTALTSVDAANSATAALAFNSLGTQINAINAYLRTFGLEATS